MNFNQSSYYRANPYHSHSYLPPGAFKNRKRPDFRVEIPQGKDFFDPTTKKHFQHNYPTTQQIVKDPIHHHSPIERQALQRSYFRSLNAKDIEGAVTNTLISKAVKNKMKAQQEILFRKQREEEERQLAKLRSFEEQQIRSRMLDQYHPHNAIGKKINYHEKQKTQSSHLAQSHFQPQQQPIKKTQPQLPIKHHQYHQPQIYKPIHHGVQHHQPQIYKPLHHGIQHHQPQAYKPIHHGIQHHQSHPQINYNDRKEELRRQEERKSIPVHKFSQPTQQYSINERFGSREEVRRHNPTFLSYGSPSFKIAGRNLIGY